MNWQHFNCPPMCPGTRTGWRWTNMFWTSLRTSLRALHQSRYTSLSSEHPVRIIFLCIQLGYSCVSIRHSSTLLHTCFVHSCISSQETCFVHSCISSQDIYSLLCCCVHAGTETKIAGGQWPFLCISLRWSTKISNRTHPK